MHILHNSGDMKFDRWLKQAQGNGWRVASVAGKSLRLQCSKTGCSGEVRRQLEELGTVPVECHLEHVGQHSKAVFDQYRALVEELRRKRRAIGIDQTDLNAAMGMADGYLNKLESFQRIATFPTLHLWAQCVGLGLTTTPIPIPDATLRAMKKRQSNGYQHSQARFKHAASG